MELQKCCFKIDKPNAKAMIEGVPDGKGNVVHQCIWLDVKTKHFPMLVTLNKAPSQFGPMLSPTGVLLNSDDYKIDHKYIAYLDSEFFIKNAMPLWEFVCHNGLFNIWSPDAPYIRFSKSKSTEDKYRICLVRLYEIDEAFKPDDVVAATARIDHLISKNKSVTIKQPVLDDATFDRVRKQLVDSISQYLTKPPIYYTATAKAGGPDTQSNEKQWTDSEYKAAVEAYLWMLEQEQHGEPYNKSKVNQDLRNGPLAARSKPSVEFRMRNISAVLEELCLPWIKGYLPAGNVRGEGKEKIKFYLANAGAYAPEDYAPTENPEDFEEKVRTLRKKIKPTGIPLGQRTPKQTSTATSGFARDPLVKAWVLENAKGICEGCGEPAPFIRSTGEPFLEHHHLKQLGEQGSDTITNSIAACPNCHRRCHHSGDKTGFVDSIYLKVLRLVRE